MKLVKYLVRQRDISDYFFFSFCGLFYLYFLYRYVLFLKTCNFVTKNDFSLIAQGLQPLQKKLQLQKRVILRPFITFFCDVFSQKHEKRDRLVFLDIKK